MYCGNYGAMLAHLYAFIQQKSSRRIERCIIGSRSCKVVVQPGLQLSRSLDRLLRPLKICRHLLNELSAHTTTPSFLAAR